MRIYLIPWSITPKPEKPPIVRIVHKPSRQASKEE
jgi:hypothetical protein